MSDKPKLTYAIQYFDDTGEMRAPYQICKGFVEAGWDVDIWAIASPKNINIDCAWGSVPVRKVDGTTKKVKLLKLAAKSLKKNKNHIVISWVWDWHCFALAAAKIIFQTPYVIVLDTYAHRSAKCFLGKVIEEIKYGFVLRNASVVLAETPCAYVHAKRHLKRPKIFLVPICLWHSDLKAIEADWKKQGFHPEREKTILYAGRLIERKNIHDLITAFGKLSDRFPEWKLEIRGPIISPEYYKRLLKIVLANNLAHRIEFLPSLSGEALYKRYRQTAIFALPSDGEGMPTTIAEASYFGGAIVAGNSGGVSYQLDDGACGLLHTPGDVDQLTFHLKFLMKSEAERKKFMQKARERVINLFTWERYFPKIEKSLRQLTEASASSSRATATVNNRLRLNSNQSSAESARENE